MIDQVNPLFPWRSTGGQAVARTPLLPGQTVEAKQLTEHDVRRIVSEMLDNRKLSNAGSGFTDEWVNWRTAARAEAA